MMNHIKKIRFHIVVSMLVLLVPAGATASISAFKFLGIEGNGASCGMSDRLGKVSGSTEHVVNIQDCTDYSGCSMDIKWGLDRTPASGALYSVKVSLPGGTCSDADLTTLGDSCMVDLLVKEKAISSPNYMTFSIPLDYLTGPECQAGWNKTTSVYIIIKESSTEITSETLSFEIDLERPPAPELEEPEEGDSNITVKWQPVEDSSDTTIEYKVYWDDSSFSNATRTNVSVAGPMSGTSYQITELENDVEYFYAVSSIDENDNESLISAVTSAMPVNVSDFWEHYQAVGGTEDGGFCFLATAAWGSYMAPEVRTLRQFRDTYLMTNAPGRAFVRFYYRVSPGLAEAISASPLLRGVTRVALVPLVFTARAMTAMPPLAGLVAGLILLVLLTFMSGVAIRSWRRP